MAEVEASTPVDAGMTRPVLEAGAVVGAGRGGYGDAEGVRNLDGEEALPVEDRLIGVGAGGGGELDRGRAVGEQLRAAYGVLVGAGLGDGDVAEADQAVGQGSGGLRDTGREGDGRAGCNGGAGDAEGNGGGGLCLGQCRVGAVKTTAAALSARAGRRT